MRGIYRRALLLRYIPSSAESKEIRRGWKEFFKMTASIARNMHYYISPCEPINIEKTAETITLSLLFRIFVTLMCFCRCIRACWVFSYTVFSLEIKLHYWKPSSKIILLFRIMQLYKNAALSFRFLNSTDKAAFYNDVLYDGNVAFLTRESKVERVFKYGSAHCMNYPVS